MKQEFHAQRQSVEELLIALHTSFGANINQAINKNSQLIEDIDLNSRVFSEIRSILFESNSLSESQKLICSEVMEEIFTDFSLAMYLCSIGLIVPARMSVRRAFELGLATVYMWDLPHEYWGWRNKDEDLSFSAMVAHLNSPGYIEYIRQIQDSTTLETICDQATFQKIYRHLSNTVHGKFSGLPTLSPARFKHDTNGIDDHLRLIKSAQDITISLLFRRFSGLEQKIQNTFPQTNRI